MPVVASATPAAPIPDDPRGPVVQGFTGRAAKAQPFADQRIPRNPWMAPNERSNIHNDAYQTDANNTRGPLGRDPEVTSTLFGAECASVTFDRRGRIVTVCVSPTGATLRMIDPKTLDTLASYELPPRKPGSFSFSNFSGGGYFYLDNRDRVVVPTTTRHIFVLRETDAPGFELVGDYDLSGSLASDDKIISALPDWEGRLWFASTHGAVGWVGRHSGKVHVRDLQEPNGNSFMVDERSSVYVVTDGALYRLHARHGQVETIWRHGYDNIGAVKPGQTQAGSGTTPTLMGGGRWVAITDNDDPMHVLAFQRGRDPRGRRLVCREPVFDAGASATDQSLVGAGRSIVAENNYGYTIAEAETGGEAIVGGLQRVDIDRDGRGCDTVWKSDERAPSVVPKLSLGAGLIYTYTLPGGEYSNAWYFTAIDFRTGETVYRRLAGGGLGYNNNYAPVTITPDGTAYVGVLGGVTRFRDG